MMVERGSVEARVLVRSGRVSFMNNQGRRFTEKVLFRITGSMELPTGAGRGQAVARGLSVRGFMPVAVGAVSFPVGLARMLVMI